MSPSEMDFQNSGEVVKKRIFQAFGLNPYVVGDVTDMNRAQAAVALGAFDRCCIVPLIQMMGQILTRFARTLTPDITVWFERPQVQDAALEQDEFEIGLSRGAVTVNEWRRRNNLPDVPGGDELREPITMAARSKPDKTHEHNGRNSNGMVATTFDRRA